MKILKSRIFKIITVLISITVLSCIIGFYAIVAAPLTILRNQYAKQAEVLQEITSRTSSPKILVTNAELRSLTDEQVYTLFSSLNETFSSSLAEAGPTFEDFVNNWLSDYDTTINYAQLTSISSFIKNKCGTRNLTEVNLEYCVAQYMTNVMTVYSYDKAAEIIDNLYQSIYSDYSNMTEHISEETPLELKELVNTMIADEDLKSDLLNNVTSLHRITEVYYEDLRTLYNYMYGETEVIQGQFFEPNAVAVSDLINLRILACNKYNVNGCYLPANISEEDTALITDIRDKARQALINCNIRFNITEDADKADWLEKIFQQIANLYYDKVYQELADYNNNELKGMLKAPMQLTDSQKSYYDYNYVFWNIWLNQLDFTKTTDLGCPTSHINRLDTTFEYAYILEGYLTFEDSELKSILWASAQQQLLAAIFEKCLLDVTDEGLVVQDTDDPLVLSARNLFEAWNLWGSQYVE